MPPRIDPLQLLRNAYNNKSHKKTVIRLKGTELYFDRDIKLPTQTQTAWQSTQTGKQFNLGSLWAALECYATKTLNRTQYFAKVGELKLELVGVADVDEIVKYFTGETSESKCISMELKAVLQQKAKMRDRPQAGFEDIDQNGEKKVKTEKFDDQTTHLLKCIEYLNNHQKPMSSKSRCLRYPQKKFSSILTHLIQNQQQAATQQRPQQELTTGKARIATFYQKKRLPIIIVPQSTIPGNVSIENIQDFLVKGEYNQYAKLKNPDASKLELQKNIKGKNIIFEVNSRPELLSEKDWEYVTAIFVIGRDKEFESWPIKDHKKIFEKALGYLVKFPKTSSGSASQWKCQLKILDPISRIEDKQIVKKIWQDIEGYLFARV